MSFTVLLAYSATLVIGWLIIKSIMRKSPLDNVPGPQHPESFMKGDMDAVVDSASGWEFNRRISEDYGGVVALCGPMGSKILYVFDPSALQRIAKKQSTYVNADWALAASKLVFGDGLLSTEGEHHRKQRKLLNPVFAIENIYAMVPIFHQIADSLRVAIHAAVCDGPRSIDIVHWLGRVSFELMGQGSMGRSFDPIVRPPESPNKMLKAIKELIPSMYRLHAWLMLSPLIDKLVPNGLRSVFAEHLPHSNFQALRRVVYALYNGSKEIFLERKAAFERDFSDSPLQDNKDLMSIIIRETMRKEDESRIPDEELVAHMTTFLIAATDTTTSLASRTLHLLSEHQDVQNKIRDELLTAQEEHGENLPGDILLKLPYFDAVIKETLRLYPPAPMNHRISKEDDSLPLSQPMRGRDGTLMDEVVVPKGTTIMLSVWSFNRAKSVWGDDADDWKPERWLKPLPTTALDVQIPGTYSNLMTFGAGKHACIGYRFALISSRVIISRMLTNFRFSPTGEKVVWNYAGVVYASMHKNSVESSLNLTVEALDGKH